MAEDCCQHKGKELEKLQKRQAKILWIILALVANLICFLLLIRHRNDNINMSSVWLCSRNDIIANTSVLLTAGLVFLTGSFLPDFILGLLLTVVFAQSAGKVLTQARAELQA